MINKTIATLSLLLAACVVQIPEEVKDPPCKDLTEYDSAVDSYFQQSIKP